MKKINYIFILLGMFLVTSCDDWFNVKPENQISSDELYSTGSGYRLQLNGIYKSLATPTLYGQELGWGFLDVLGQYYVQERLDDNYKEVNDRKYGEKAVKHYTTKIWENMFHAIADCNNLIEHLVKESSSSFEYGEPEYAKIHGEALAIRAMVHFDLLRLFAPSPKADDGGKYIPYVTDSHSVSNVPLTVNQTLEKIIGDLEKAETLLVAWDSSLWWNPNYNHGAWIPRYYDVINDSRFELYSNDETLSLFFRATGYRMHTLAAKAILARVYSYMGKTEEAYEEAKAVCDFEIQDMNRIPFEFDNWLDGVKFTGDVIFGLYNEENGKNYEPYVGVNRPLILRNISYLFADDGGSDYRFKRQTSRLEDASGYISIKNKKESNYTPQYIELIPIIRKSELYYIMCEYLCEKDQLADAISLLEEVKSARGDITSISSISSVDNFLKVMNEDTRREFIGEGQSFFFYKRLNIPLYDAVNHINFGTRYYLPIPDSEHVIF